MDSTKNKKERLARLQGQIAIASFTTGVIIACICLFVVEPLGEISTSALSLVSELLILAGALLGVQLAVDAKLQKFLARAKEIAKEPVNPGNEPANPEEDE